MFRKRKVYGKKVADDSWKIHKDHALTLVQEIIKTLPSNFKFEFNHLRVRNQKTRWGSCSSKGNLNFNYRIIYLPYELAEYLVIHELCHLKEMNHSKKYWLLVKTLCPNHKILSKRLKKFPMKR